jgi:hypothetical protein
MGSGSEKVVDRPARIEALKAMFQRYADQPDAARLGFYVDDTRYLPLQVLQQAIHKAIQNHRGSFAPGPGDILAQSGVFLARYRDREEEAAFLRLESAVSTMTLPNLHKRLDWLSSESVNRSHWVSRMIDLLVRTIHQRDKESTT